MTAQPAGFPAKVAAKKSVKSPPPPQLKTSVSPLKPTVAVPNPNLGTPISAPVGNVGNIGSMMKGGVKHSLSVLPALPTQGTPGNPLHSQLAFYAANYLPSSASQVQDLGKRVLTDAQRVEELRKIISQHAKLRGSGLSHS